MARTGKPLTAKSSIGDWLKDPAGAAVLNELLAAGGQDASALKPVRMFSLQRLVALSQGMLTQEMVDEMVRRVEAGDVPAGAAQPTETDAAGADVADADDEADIEIEPFEERITPGRFAGKTVIVTGAGSGIGRATASRIAREGGKVVAVDVVKERVDEFAASLPDADIVALAEDITSEEGVARIVAAAGGRVDGLANVAGIMDDMTPVHEVTDAVWQRVIAVNLFGTFNLTRAVLPLMLAAHRGSIVNVASEASLRGSAAGAAYTASKHGVVGLTKSSAFMYGPSGIRVNAVAPGGVLTGIQASFNSKLGAERVNALLPTAPPVAEAAQLAASITFLLSDDGTNVNGAILPSDGGWSAQ